MKRETTQGELGLSSPFCTICAFLADAGGRLACAAFPQGIPITVYPGGCGHRSTRKLGFMPRPGMQEAARRWLEFDQQRQPLW